MILPLSYPSALVSGWSGQFNLPNSATVLGLMEMAFAVLFIIPKTMRIGFILRCYFSGAMATELSHDGSILNPAVPLAFVWITAFLVTADYFSALQSHFRRNVCAKRYNLIGGFLFQQESLCSFYYI